MCTSGSIEAAVQAAILRVSPQYTNTKQAQSSFSESTKSSPADVWDQLVSADGPARPFPLTVLDQRKTCVCEVTPDPADDEAGDVLFPDVTTIDLDSSSLPPSAAFAAHVTDVLRIDDGNCGGCGGESATRLVIRTPGVLMFSPIGDARPPESFDLLREEDIVEFKIVGSIIKSSDGAWNLSERGEEGVANWAIYQPKTRPYAASRQPPEVAEDDHVFLDDEGQWACLHCGGVYTTRGGAAVHALYCTDRQEQQCLDCGQWVEGDWAWENHAEFHRSGHGWRCKLGCTQLWFGSAEGMRDHHLHDHGTTYRDAAATNSVPVPLLSSARVRPSADGAPRFSAELGFAAPRRYIQHKACSHCGTTRASAYRFASFDSTSILCRACIAYSLSQPDSSLPPPSLLAKRQASPPRRTRKGERRIVRKRERSELRASQSAVTCCNENCAATVNINEARNTSTPGEYLCLACATWTRRNAGAMRPRRLLDQKERRASGAEYKRPEHTCSNCRATSAPRWYRADNGHICAYCRLYEKAHGGDMRPAWLEEQRRAKGIQQSCRNCRATDSRTWWRVPGRAGRECENCQHYRKQHGGDRPLELEMYRNASPPQCCSHCGAVVSTSDKWFRDGAGGHRCMRCHRYLGKHGRLPSPAELAKRKPIPPAVPKAPVPCRNAPCGGQAKTAGLCKRCYDYQRAHGGQARPMSVARKRRQRTAPSSSALAPAAFSSAATSSSTASPSSPRASSIATATPSSSRVTLDLQPPAPKRRKNVGKSLN